MNIKPASIKAAKQIANIVSISNKDVALKFNINNDNNPKHPSFYDEQWVLDDFKRGEEYFLYELDGKYVACVAFEQRDKKAYLNRLSVLPSYRKQGIGEKLVKYIFSYSKEKELSHISIGIIAKHSHLKNWYLKLGFIENGLKEFTHLPFDVLFMKYNIDT